MKADVARDTPSDFTLEGSADGSTWTELDVRTGITWTNHAELTFSLGQTGAFGGHAATGASCAAPATLSNNDGANNFGKEAENSGGFLVTLANGDTVWTQSTSGCDCRSIANAFDGQHGNWNLAWHGAGTGGWRTTPLQLHYTFAAGDHVIEGVKVWQAPNHQAGQIDVMYWKDGAWVAASGQSPAGIESVSDDSEATINTRWGT